MRPAAKERESSGLTVIARVERTMARLEMPALEMLIVAPSTGQPHVATAREAVAVEARQAESKEVVD